MINFFILNGTNKRTCTATDAHKAAQILTLVFPQNKAYVLENDKIVFAHNMSVEEAEAAAGIQKLQSMEVLPITAPKAAAVKAKKPAKAKKPVKKAPAKKTKVKSKVVVKNKKAAPKKAVVKVKPKTKKPTKSRGKAKPKGKKR